MRPRLHYSLDLTLHGKQGDFDFDFQPLCIYFTPSARYQTLAKSTNSKFGLVYKKKRHQTRSCVMLALLLMHTTSATCPKKNQ